MPFDGGSFLDTADRLCTSQDEHGLRTAIGRSYYGVFWRARDMAAKEASSPAEARRYYTRGAHSEVLSFVRASRDKARKTLGYDIADLMEARHKADYEATYVPNNIDLEKEAVYLAGIARRAIAAIEQMRKAQ